MYETQDLREIPSASRVEIVGNRIQEEERMTLLLGKKVEGEVLRSPDQNRTQELMESS